MGKGLTLAQQAIGLRSRFPDAHITVGTGRLVFIGDLTPSPLSRTYLVRIDFDGIHRPSAKVLAPILERPPTEELPHTFEDDALCLHLPGEWNMSEQITYTIVPWAAEWLLHYEVWLATDGTWCGGGHEPAPA